MLPRMWTGAGAFSFGTSCPADVCPARMTNSLFSTPERLYE